MYGKVLTICQEDRSIVKGYTKEFFWGEQKFLGAMSSVFAGFRPDGITAPLGAGPNSAEEPGRPSPFLRLRIVHSLTNKVKSRAI